VRIAIAGCTGSIGTQTLDVVAAEQAAGRGGDYEVVALAGRSNARVIIEQGHRWRPRVVAVADETARRLVRDAIDFAEVTDTLTDVVDGADVVINGVVGFAGLPVTMATLAAGKRLGLANKESLISAGPIVQPLRLTPGAELVPVDSEHCAVHQCLRSSARPETEVSRIVLTASGGPFRGRTLDELSNVTVADALNHPTWSMGPKITIDSSTLMNKGLEVIEAHELFGVGYDQIDVVVHHQSVVHSMVEWADGATIAQLSLPDMKLCIGYALAWPNRIATAFGRIDWTALTDLSFAAPDRSTFRCLDLAYAAGRAGGSAPAALSGANEVVVDAFLLGRLRWSQIGEVLSGVIDRHHVEVLTSIDDVLAADADGRRLAHEALEALT
jgi:1-deoxy-D-xylulose-5-phosphate reductoisomerase